MSKKWTNVCTQCGKSGGTIRTASNGAPPTYTVPSIVGSCPCTSDKKHPSEKIVPRDFYFIPISQ